MNHSPLSLDYINRHAQKDPARFVRACEERYDEMIRRAAKTLKERSLECPVVLLTGPTSSGKTTTAQRLGARLAQEGVMTHTISMDDYYKTRGAYEVPRDEGGNLDLESPLCMDLELLGEHLKKLALGQQIQLPLFDFATQSRRRESRLLRLRPGEMVIIEGIHAFNSQVTFGIENLATKVYVSVEDTVVGEGEDMLTPNMLRFVRRAVRDYNYRNSSYENTLNMWPSVRRGERLYIQPFASHADLTLNTFLAYEPCIFMNMLTRQLRTDEEALIHLGLRKLYEMADQFVPIDYRRWLPRQSLLHEFVK